MLLSVGEFFNPHNDSEWQEVLSALIKGNVFQKSLYLVDRLIAFKKSFIIEQMVDFYWNIQSC